MSRPEPRVARRLLLAAVAGLACVGLVSCAGIPTSGPVHTGGGSANERNEPDARLIGQPPVPGMAPKDVVQGFVAASAAFDGDHAVARQYLAPDAASTWDVGSGARIYDPRSVRYDAAGSDKVVLTFSEIGTISKHGVYDDTVPPKQQPATFSLARVDGEWRISALPFPDLLLDLSAVQRTYRTYSLFFLDPTATVVVPQPVLVPAGPGASTALVSALLAGPPPWLAPAVRSAVPANTGLAVDSVPVRDGVAQVDLVNQNAAPPGEAQASALSAQLSWTLRQLPGVGSLRVTLDGAPLRVPGVGDIQDVDSWTSFDPDVPISADPVFVLKGRVNRLHDGKAVPVAGQAGDGSLTLTSPSLALDGTKLAALSGDRHTLYTGDLGRSMTISLHSSSALTAPSWDRSGSVWTVDRSTGTAYLAKPGQAAQPVATTGRPAGDVLALRIARDGTRAAVIVGGPSGGQVYLARVERSQGKVALTGFRSLLTSYTRPTDVAWAASDLLVLLARSSTSEQAQPFVVDLTGSSANSPGPLPPEARVVSVTAAPGQQVLASTDDGRLLRGGVEWSDLGAGSLPAYPG